MSYYDVLYKDDKNNISLEKQLRKYKKKLREIEELKLYDNLNEDQRNKLNLETKIKNEIEIIEEFLHNKTKPQVLHQHVQKKKKKKKNISKPKKKNKITEEQRKSYKKHREKVKEEKQKRKWQEAKHNRKWQEEKHQEINEKENLKKCLEIFELQSIENITSTKIGKIYRKLSLKHHPDKKGGNKENMQELNKAKEVLHL